MRLWGMLRDMAARWNVQTQKLPPSGKTSLTRFSAVGPLPRPTAKTRFTEHRDGQTRAVCLAILARTRDWLPQETQTASVDGGRRQGTLTSICGQPSPISAPPLAVWPTCAL